MEYFKVKTFTWSSSKVLKSQCEVSPFKVTTWSKVRAVTNKWEKKNLHLPNSPNDPKYHLKTIKVSNYQYFLRIAKILTDSNILCSVGVAMAPKFIRKYYMTKYWQQLIKQLITYQGVIKC